MYFLYILLAILIFGILVATHELGHFTAAKLFRVRVNEFSIGMGPAIWKKQGKETLYALRCIPFGGYCAMEGEEEQSEDPRAFSNAMWLKRLVILVAGAFMNFLVGFLVLACIYGLPARYAQLPVPVVSSLETGCSLSEGGVQAGDRIYSIDGERVYTTDDIVNLPSMLGGNRFDLVVIRRGEKVTLPDVPYEARTFSTESGQVQRYGINLTLQDRNLGTLLSYSANSGLGMVRVVRLSLQMLLTGRASVADMAGPVGIVKVMADAGTQSATTALGIWTVLYLAALIAINLGVMNLLPIPALDGGRVVGLLLTTLVEAVLRRKVNPKIENYIHAGGMILLLALMAVILLKDVIWIVR